MQPYFKYIEIPKLSDIQQEVYQNYDAILDERSSQGVDSATHKVKDFSVFIVGTNSILTYSPSLVEYLQAVDLLDDLKVIAFVTLSGNSFGFPHADVFYSNCINLPIHNCKGGRTYFFNDQDADAVIAGGKLKAGYKPIPDPGEVQAVSDVNRPQWFNTFKVHQAVNESPNTRYSMSLRFGKDWDPSTHSKTKLV
tara:strand:+ start:15 stop:599 length:585 start_codon:yes stop_codon:yes gene_type:complete